MVVSVVIPSSGMGITEAVIVKWLKQPGERVQAGEAIAEFETAKSVLDLEAPASGVLKSILFQENDTVEVGIEIATIEEA
jgi:pyruvate/2-oxoglutarate dehydrogenase complex dihydrolipoamide acyltransferase (E2) component